MKQINLNVIININNDLLNKISYINNKTDRKEWSGILIYELEDDNIFKLKDTSINLVDVLLMDIGHETFTSFEYENTDILDIIDKYDITSGKRRMGLIHSHANMNVFFSSTDMDELVSNSKNHQLYLSVIVNNKLEVIAKLGFKINLVEIVNETIEVFGKVIKNKRDIKKETVGIIDCKINKQADYVEEVDKRIDELIKRKQSKSSPQLDLFSYKTNNDFIDTRYVTNQNPYEFVHRFLSFISSFLTDTSKLYSIEEMKDEINSVFFDSDYKFISGLENPLSYIDYLFPDFVEFTEETVDEAFEFHKQEDSTVRYLNKQEYVSKLLNSLKQIKDLNKTKSDSIISIFIKELSALNNKLLNSKLIK